MNELGPRPERSGSHQARRVLLDLPASLWSETARTLRRARGRMPRAELPARVRPFADWKPDRLHAGRPREAMAAVLADEPRVRAALGDELPGGLAGDRDVRRLAAEVGAHKAAVALVAAARWEDLAALASEVSARERSAQRVAGEATDGEELARLAGERDRLAGELGTARREQRRLRDELASARRRAEAADAERDELRGRVTELEAQVRELDERRRQERRRSRDREQRLRRRAERAEARAELNPEEVGAAADEMSALAERLHRATGKPAREEADATSGQTGGDEAGALAASAHPVGAAVVPRAVPPAEPGRPCRLPPGVRADAPAGVEALLKVPAITVLVDGYNVTKDPHGRPATRLGAQRDWLIQLASAVAARYRCRMVLVFDGTDHDAPSTASVPGVLVVFSRGDELADDRLIALLEGLDETAPACVVSSDRAVAEQAAARCADVVASSSFLAAVA